MQIEEATLTGGSVGVGKHAATLDQPSLALGDRRNMAYAGTVASYDRSRAIVVASSVNTEFGQMAQMLQTVDTSRIPLQANLDQVGMVPGGVTFVVVAVIVALGVLGGQPFNSMLIFGVALAVAVCPIGLIDDFFEGVRGPWRRRDILKRPTRTRCGKSSPDKKSSLALRNASE